MSLRIKTTNVQIGINTHKGKLSIEQPKGQLSIKQSKPQVKIETQLPKVKIDQKQCFAEAGLKDYLQLTKEVVRLGKKSVMEGIARKVQDGNRMARIEKGRPPAIPEIAEKNAWNPQYDFNIQSMPKSRPKIEFEASQNIEWELGDVKINYEVKKPIINYKRGKVDIYIKQKPSIKIRYIDQKV